MIDWCVQCADAGCIMTKRKDLKHRMFAYIFVRIMKDALVMYQELNLLKRLRNDDESWTTVWVLDKMFYKNFIFKKSVEQIIGKTWFRKSYWSFMRYMIAENVTDIDLWNDYNFKTVVLKSGEIYFMFSLRKTGGCVRKNMCINV